MRNQNIINGLASGLISLLVACQCGNTNQNPDPYNATTLLNDYSNDVVYATYADLNTKAAALLTATNTLNTTPNLTNLQTAQTAWVAARVPWESSEAWLFGPVDTEGFDPRLDSWPLDKAALDAIIASSDTLNKAYVDGLADEVRGFHTIEYLLFDDGTGTTNNNGSDVDADILTALQGSARRMQFLVATVESLKGTTQALADAWDPANGNFVDTFASAGTGNTTYPSQTAALEEIIDGMIGIADEVGTGKLNGPYTSQDPREVESRYAKNSIVDFQNDIRGIKLVVDGASGSMGFQDFVQTVKSEELQPLKDAITAAIDAIGAIPAPFDTAITDATTGRPAVEAAIDATVALSTRLSTNIKPLINN